MYVQHKRCTNITSPSVVYEYKSPPLTDGRTAASVAVHLELSTGSSLPPPTADVPGVAVHVAFEKANFETSFSLDRFNV
jgi:hypothetical protein